MEPDCSRPATTCRVLSCGLVQYAVALSEHPNPGIAIGEAVGQILDQVGPGPDLAVLFIAGHHVDSARQSGEVIRSTLGVQTLVGATAVSVLAQRQEIEESPAVVLWAGHTGPCRPLRLGTDSSSFPDVEPGSSVVILADPVSYDPSVLLSALPPSHELLTESHLAALPEGSSLHELSFLLVPGLLTKWYPLYMSQLLADLSLGSAEVGQKDRRCASLQESP